jgi:hypothetical protein
MSIPVVSLFFGYSGSLPPRSIVALPLSWRDCSSSRASLLSGLLSQILIWCASCAMPLLHGRTSSCRRRWLSSGFRLIPESPLLINGCVVPLAHDGSSCRFWPPDVLCRGGLLMSSLFDCFFHTLTASSTLSLFLLYSRCLTRAAISMS